MWKGFSANLSRGGDYKTPSDESTQDIMLESRNRDRGITPDHLSIVRTVEMQSFYEHDPDHHTTHKKKSSSSSSASRPNGLDLDNSHSATQSSATITTTVITNPDPVYFHRNRSNKSVAVRTSDGDINQSATATRRSSSGTRESSLGRGLPQSSYSPSDPQIFVWCLSFIYRFDRVNHSFCIST